MIPSITSITDDGFVPSWGGGIFVSVIMRPEDAARLKCLESKRMLMYG